MKLYQNDNDVIFLETTKPKRFICYRDNQIIGQLRYDKPVNTVYHVRDDARCWYETWLKRIDDRNVINGSI